MSTLPNQPKNAIAPTQEDEGDFQAMKAEEARIMQDWRWGNLTVLGVANHLRRAGFDSRYATDKANSLATPAPTVDETDRLRGIVSDLRGALEHLENANEALASKRSRATYLAMEAEARDELIMLDEARRNARAALSDRPQAEGEVK